MHRAAKLASVEKEGSAKPSRALHGVRFLFALCVVQYHVGFMPNEGWAKFQSFTMNMTGFFILLAFTMSAKTASKAVEPHELRNYYTNRFAAPHGIYLLAVLFTLPVFWLTILHWESLFPLIYIAGAVATVVGFTGIQGLLVYPLIPSVIGPAWFQVKKKLKNKDEINYNFIDQKFIFFFIFFLAT